MRLFAGIILLTLACMAPARAQVPEIRFAQQFSMAYLRFDVMRHRDLLQKHAVALGIPAVKVSFTVFNGPDMMNDALLSGAIDVASGGVPGLLTIWNKTRGTAQEVRGVAALSQQPVLLTARDPRLKSIRDFGPNDRIAVPAVKVSAQAVMLQMAAAREWGDAAYDRLDPLTFALSPPDATAGMLSGRSDYAATFTVPPYQDPGVHVVLSSEDILGVATGGTAWTTKRFHDANPKLYQALIDALKEASEFVAANPRETAEYYAEDVKRKIDIDLMLELPRDPRYRYVLTPQATMKWAGFMAKVGRLKNPPASWKGLFWPEIHELDGS